MDLAALARRTLSRSAVFRVSRFAARLNIAITAPMHSLVPGRAEWVSQGEYVRTATLDLVSREIADHKTPGAVAELGVYRGEFAQFISAAFPDRPFYLFDTFGGFPEEDLTLDQQRWHIRGDDGIFASTSVRTVLSRMPYPEKCIVKQGRFPDTTCDCLNEIFAYVSIDADLYNPIYSGLSFFYPRLAPGGYVFVHDYNNAWYCGAKTAVRDYCQQNQLPYIPLPDPAGSAIIAKPVSGPFAAASLPAVQNDPAVKRLKSK